MWPIVRAFSGTTCGLFLKSSSSPLPAEEKFGCASCDFPPLAEARASSRSGHSVATALISPRAQSVGGGRMMMQIVGSFAEFERNLIRERTSAGIAIAKALGKHLGRPSKLSPQQQKEILRSLRIGEKTAAELARLFQISPSAISRLQKKT